MPRNLKAEARRIFEAGLAAVDPKRAVEKLLSMEKNILRIGEEKLDLQSFNSLWVFGAGKGSAAMAQAVEEILGEFISGGLVVVKHSYVAPLKKILLVEAGHPTPDEDGWRAAQEMAETVAGLGPQDLVLFMLSGGGSALLPLPASGITLAEKMAATNLLLQSGASIREINTLRKHLSRIKGGQLARLAYPARLISLILSDVVGDPLDVVASGPTVADPTTFEDCKDVVNRYALEEKLPPSVKSYMQAGADGKIPETPKSDDPLFAHTATILVGTNLQALQAAANEAKKLGYTTMILSSMIEGDTTQAAGFHAALVKEIVNSGNPLKYPACLISGGETTVVVRGQGKGGRNLEFALAAAIDLEGLAGVCLLSGGTDGTDGPTDAAGAIVDGETVAQARVNKLEPKKFLEENDSYNFFHHLDGLLITGPTNTNVMDIRVILVR